MTLEDKWNREDSGLGPDENGLPRCLCCPQCGNISYQCTCDDGEATEKSRTVTVHLAASRGNPPKVTTDRA